MCSIKEVRILLGMLGGGENEKQQYLQVFGILVDIVGVLLCHKTIQSDRKKRKIELRVVDF